MSHKNIHHIAMSIIIALPLTTHGMQRVLTLAKPHFSLKQTERRSFFSFAPELRNKIAVPEFNLSDTKKLIASTLPESNKLDGCKINGLIEYIVFKATEYKSHEKKYAAVLKQLREHGWSKGECCVSVMLHSAVISNLPKTTKELLAHDKNWVHDLDFNKCIPLHYAQTPLMAHMLLDNGSKTEACDRDGNTPLHTVPSNVVPVLLNAGAYIHAENALLLRIPGHGWQSITPLRKAVDEGDVQKCHELLQHKFIISQENEEAILLSLADLRFWRTEDQVYLKIKNMILGHCRYHFEEKH